MNLIEHLKRQIAFSRATFGPGPRTAGVIDHIRKELVEIETATSPGSRAKEWTDVVILALEGLWRELSTPNVTTDVVAQAVVEHIIAKQNRNELRTWPDWRTAPADKAIEHDRSGEWIPWIGGKCPVDPKTLVDVKFRSGAITTDVEAEVWNWYHSDLIIDHKGDIIAYRVTD